MLICLGGFLGSGRRILAHKLSQKHALHLYDTEAKKIHLQLFNKEGRVKEVTRRPNTDELRMLFFRRILEDFQKLSKMYPDMIVEDAFHREKSREFFFEEAKKYFDSVVFVWIESSESSVPARLKKMKEHGMIKSVEAALKRRERVKEQFQPFSRPPLVFNHEASDDAAAERLWTLIQEFLRKK